MKTGRSQHDEQLGRRGAESARGRAEAYAKDPGRTRRLLESAKQKAERQRGRVREMREPLMTLIRLVRAWATGRYRTVPWGSIVWAIAALIYFVAPFDLVPDWILGAGYVDDAAVVGWVMKSIRDDLNAFAAWEQSTAA